ncbi:hypothetical protein AVEN_102936-1 [Araneus ventricosus]|uniref:Uncharacterized protein n=1 Tax=Araneus ventricosus TaxID=182803 RepID=A0A4Y2VG57_ARAVE|nr:hypothetical protein AVEN_102936-1 [Araneus ventricosus]
MDPVGPKKSSKAYSLPFADGSCRLKTSSCSITALVGLMVEKLKRILLLYTQWILSVKEAQKSCDLKKEAQNVLISPLYSGSCGLKKEAQKTYFHFTQMDPPSVKEAQKVIFSLHPVGHRLLRERSKRLFRFSSLLRSGSFSEIKNVFNSLALRGGSCPVKRSSA